MNAKFWPLVVLMSVGCGQVTAEPIESAEGTFPIQSVEVTDPPSVDAYACEVVQVPPRGTPGADDSPVGFIDVGVLAYAGTCANRGSTGLDQCWYTGPRRCGGDRACGGFVASKDPATGAPTLSGGQHMLCEYPCKEDSECPAPSSGTARATCMRSPEFNPATDGGSCMLGCGAGETCPDGFVCIEPGLSFGLSDGSEWPAPAQCVQFKSLVVPQVGAP